MIQQEHTDWRAYYERMRYKLVLHLCYFFIVLMSLVALINAFNEKFSALPNALAAVMCVVGVVIMRRTGNHQFVGVFCSVISLIIISSAFFTLKTIHFLTPVWMIVNILFTFFALGKRWGIGILIAHFLALFVYIWTYHEQNILRVDHFTTNDLVTFMMEFGVIGFCIGYILVLYTQTTRFSQQLLQRNNEVLLEQNSLILRQKSEMQVMLNEIHHRVKNNMQIVTSLLRLQASKSGKENDLFYKEAIDRVSAMALVHEQMYQSQSLSKINLYQYVQDLSANLLQSYSLNKQVHMRSQIDLEHVYAKTVVPFALLFNELFANSLKHAFDQTDEPVITIKLSAMDSDRFVFEFADNGTWKEPTGETLGVEIIQAMTDQLEGEMGLCRDASGTHYRFVLKNIGGM